ncbi:MAG: sigma-70 family RNA polymerase sigma factor [Planctomycetes bacterium]|nr:sigma-70 family RNA polymerase sigma factor [Planctomycetota bacterium]MCC7170022.1 sigma-70 family RNA polymerase sigma factor [Planctomycetota bacterium]
MSRLAQNAPSWSSEPELVARLKCGDDDAYRHLVETRAPRLLRVLESLLADRAEAEDVLTETFSIVFRKIEQFDGRAQLSTWIHRIGVNAALLRMRARKTRREVRLETTGPDDDTASPGSVSIEAFTTDSDDTSAAVDAADVALSVREAIDTLSEKHRTILLLRDIEQRDSAEIARWLGITRNALKIRVHRARQALKVALEERFGNRLAESLGIRTHDAAAVGYDALPV